LLACEALPGSTLIHFEYSLFLERHLLVDEAMAVFNTLTKRDCLSLAEKQLATIHQLLFTRRAKGMMDARRFWFDAHVSPNSCWQLEVVMARIELFINRDPTTCRKVFERGQQKYPKHIPFLLQYISTLYSMNEVRKRCLNYYLKKKKKKTQGNKHACAF
jgi:hypothetical protein